MMKLLNTISKKLYTCPPKHHSKISKISNLNQIPLIKIKS